MGGENTASTTTAKTVFTLKCLNNSGTGLGYEVNPKQEISLISIYNNVHDLHTRMDKLLRIYAVIPPQTPFVPLTMYTVLVLALFLLYT